MSSRHNAPRTSVGVVKKRDARAIDCLACSTPTRAKGGLCISCKPVVERAVLRPEQPCTWCGGITKAANRICLSCRPLERLANITDAPIATDALTRGTWHPRPGGIKVWISWDELAA